MKAKQLVFFIGTMLLFMIIVTPLGGMVKIYDNPIGPQSYQKDMKTMSSSWQCSNILIDDSGYNGMTWLEAVSYEWCSGKGEIDEPYLIENGKISGRIYISYSSVYFIIKNCTVNGGIRLTHTTNGIVRNNTVIHGDETGIGLLYQNSHNKIIGNTLVGTGLGIYLVIDCTDNEIRDNKIDNSSMGISLNQKCNYNNIINNRINYNVPGIYDYGALAIANSHYNTLSRNVIKHSTRSGIYLGADSSNNNVTDNIACFNNEDGIYTVSARFNLISNNFISNNTRYGIFLRSGNEYREYNIITENRIQYNKEIGIFLDGSSNNLVYRNIFIGNGKNAGDGGDSNKFNTTQQGNYWDDYTGQDANGDGIGDEPYFVGLKYYKYDYLPLCYYGPMSLVTLPKTGQGFHVLPPNFSVSVFSPYIDTIWYTLKDNPEHFIIRCNATIDPSNWASFEDGPVEISFYINDTLGNIYSQEIVVIKDTTNPEIFIHMPKIEGFFSDSPPSFEVEIQEHYVNKTWYILELDGMSSERVYFTDNETIQSAVWTPIADGNITIIFCATDVADNLSKKNVTIHKDTVPPLLEIISPVDEQIFHSVVPYFNLSIYDLNLHSIWYTLDKGFSNHTLENEAGLLNQTLWDKLPKGVISLQFYVLDKAGNIFCKEVFIIKEISEENNNFNKDKSEVSHNSSFPQIIPTSILIIVSIGIAGVLFLLKKRL